ncbi:hypothetical protein SESBI_31150 [Sesbania bispinosa]|nr:hypothetical protein SESBI_31150 [Sesbania bispinosa]
MKDAILRNEEEQEAEARVPAEDMRPWNLRTRRAECKAPVAASAEKKRGCISPARNDGAVNLPKLRSASEKTTRREKFSVQLSRKEVEGRFHEDDGPPATAEAQ